MRVSAFALPGGAPAHSFNRAWPVVVSAPLRSVYCPEPYDLALLLLKSGIKLPFFLHLRFFVALFSWLPMHTCSIDNRLIGMIFAHIYEYPDQFGVPGCRSRSDRRENEAAVRAQWNQDDRQD
jgi:hypothetical protein